MKSKGEEYMIFHVIFTYRKIIFDSIISYPFFWHENTSLHKTYFDYVKKYPHNRRRYFEMITHGMFIPILTSKHLFNDFISSIDNWPIFFMSLNLLMVLICSKRTIESRINSSLARTTKCVGICFLCLSKDVIDAIIVVSL